MSTIRYNAPINVLISTKGHPFQRDDFFNVFEAMPDIAYTAVEQPAAQTFFSVENAAPYDAFVLYDMPGIDFGAEDPPQFVDPPEKYKEQFLALLEKGHGFVFLHHAIAGWPTWETYAEIVGGRFFYRPSMLRGQRRQDSGYRHDVTHTVSVVDPGHPVVAGIGESFSITDELYLCEIFDEDVTPILKSDFAFTRDNFYSATLAVKGQMNSNEGWDHAEGRNLIGWVKRYGNSPIVYLQCGDAPQAYENPAFKRLIENAIRWVASDEARGWARKG